MKTSIFRKNFVLIVVSVLVATLAFITIAISVTDRLFIESSSSVLIRSAKLAAYSFQPGDLAGDGLTQPGIDTSQPASGGKAATRIREISQASGYRVTLIRNDGTVIADSDAPVPSMENHGDRPEVVAALKGAPGWSVRTSKTTNIRTLYAAVPMNPAGTDGPSFASAPVFILRLAMPLPSTFKRLLGSQWIFILFFVFISVLSVIVSLAINRQIAKPIKAIVEKAEAYAQNADPKRGSAKALPEELRVLDASLDSMVKKIQLRSKETEELGTRYSSILEAAGEGIIATDSSRRILEVNSAFVRLFSVSKSEIIGKSILEALNNHELSEIFDESMNGKKELFKEIRIFENGEKHLKVHATVFGTGTDAIVVAVINDITGLKRLETIRKDFVANVSHELRTPVQIIRGYAEILAGENTDLATMKKYLFIIEHNSKRMERIVNDLLMLARLENDPGNWLTVEACDAVPIIRSAVASIEPRAQQKHIGIRITAPGAIAFVANAGLVEQALVNLLDNALQYSPDGSDIEILAEAKGPNVVISVKDRGIGIPPNDLDHIFERFYRVDKSRNKNTGGTGLGLAIVKHVATAHEGDVRAESYINEGSVFTLSLPLAGPSRARDIPSSL